jgi:hypothetical protein
VDSEFRDIKAKESDTESTAIYEESDNWNQCAEWNIGVGTEWIRSVGESGYHERWNA